MRTLKITLAYDGTRFVGWQKQPNGVSVQQLLEEALAPLNEGVSPKVAGAGRTDAGVHAAGQVASCECSIGVDVAAIERALNARLPPDIRVTAVCDAAAGFHARFHAVSKTYLYQILNGHPADPLARGFVWYVPQPLDVEAMRAALTAIVGRHDFRALQAAGSVTRSTVRTIVRAELAVTAWPGVLGQRMLDSGAAADVSNRVPLEYAERRLLSVDVTGDGFLRHMVRNLVGTLVEVGLGRSDVSTFTRVLAGGDRKMAGPTAPAHGLTLVRVEYGQ